MNKQFINCGTIHKTINDKQYAFMYELYKFESWLRGGMWYELRVDFLIKTSKYSEYDLLERTEIEFQNNWAMNAIIELQIKEFIVKCIDKIENK